MCINHNLSAGAPATPVRDSRLDARRIIATVLCLEETDKISRKI